MQVLVLGAGQLARMMALAGAPLGIEVRAYDVRSHRVVHPLTWQDYHQDLQAGLDGADIVSAEFEHIPPDILSVAEASQKFLPGAEAIQIGGDRRLEKQLLDNAGVPNARYAVVETKDDLYAASDTIGLPMILKSALDGYDGKGQWRIKSKQDIDTSWPDISDFIANSRADQAMVAETWIPFDREVSLVGARSVEGEIQCYALTQNHHHEGILILSVAPSGSDDLQNQAMTAFKNITNTMNYVGVLAIEFFDVQGQLMVNELAPRVHNSGHWTQQGAVCCQFENHLRAVCGLPLGSTALRIPTAMINAIGIDSVPAELLAMADVHQHWYGKEKRPGRKVGHINVSSDDLIPRLTEVAARLPAADFPGLYHALKSYQ
jgi:5-(carboxyamino)imidazole ribonucleotide synthase